MQGNVIIAQAFARQQIKQCFGVIGVPVIELGYALQAHGIEYYGFRNEQAASYAASGIGYLTQSPGLCLVVSGPGLIHALAGAANAQTNGWSMVILAGSSDLGQIGQGSFQEYDQVSLVRPYVKFAARITDLRLAPQLIEQAVRISMVGRPGCTYIEVPGDILRQTIDTKLIKFPEPFNIERLPICQALDSQVQLAVKLLQSAKNPLIIIGKGCAMSRAESIIREYVNYTGLPFLPTPMGKGVVPDSHQCNISPARSLALGQADVVLLLGARLNWILHFGHQPRFQKDVQIIHVDISPEEFDTNVQSAVNLFGDIKTVVSQLLTCIESNKQLDTKQNKWNFNRDSSWWSTLQKKIVENKAANQELIDDKSLPLQYYSSIGIVAKYLPEDCMVIGEGSNTMDIGRTIIQHQNPRLKMDSGTFATMGLGMGFCIAAKLVYPTKQVFAVVGDSAFGFSAMELETATRYNLPIVVIIINNNGIFMGVDELATNNAEIPVTALNPSTAYELLGDALGAKGFLIKTHEALHNAMKEVISNPKKSYVLNVKISSSGQKKPQEHSWLTQSKL